MRALPSRKLDKRITRVWRLSAFFNLFIWGGICCLLPLGIIAFALDLPKELSKPSAGDAYLAAQVFMSLLLGALAVFAILFIIFVIIVPKIRWIQWSFDIYEEEIDIHKGIFWRKRIIIPLIRVQNVDTRQGPLMRMVKLSSFTVSTAAGEHEIPGLANEEADALRDRVAVLARIAQEDV